MDTSIVWFRLRGYFRKQSAINRKMISTINRGHVDAVKKVPGNQQSATRSNRLMLKKPINSKNKRKYSTKTDSRLMSLILD